ncbi:MAG: glycosyltransferase [Candidatus Nezhaarchaeales archaeon]
MLVVVGLTYLTFHLWMSRASLNYSVPKGYLKETPIIAFHIPVKNEHPSLLERLLSSIARLKYPKDRIKVVVVCDDKDPKPMMDVCERAKEKLDVVFIHRDKARGFKAGALNEALKVESDLIVVLDVDSIVPPDFLIKALPSFYEADNVAAVSIRWEAINVKESLLSEAYSFGQNFFMRGLFRGFQARFGSFMLLGSGCLVKRKALMEVGGWDEKCVAEDLELGIRLRLRGYRVVYNDSAFIWLEAPSRYSDFKAQQRRWSCGISQLLSKHFKHILTSKLKASEKLSLLIYLTQYWGLAFIGVSMLLLPLLVLLNGEPPLLPLLILIIPAISISAMAVYGYELMKYKLSENSLLRNIKVLGRAAALTAAMSLDSLIYSLRPLVGMKCSWKVTPKGPLKKLSRGTFKLELGLTALLLITLVVSVMKSFIVLTAWTAIYLVALVYVLVKRFE